MLPIHASSFNQMFDAALSNVQNIKAAKKLKKMKKVQAVEYFFTLPLIVASVLEQYLSTSKDSDVVRILIDDVVNKDFVDQFCWLSVVPALIGRPNIRLQFVAINSVKPKSTITNGKNLIDYYIRHEMADGQFSVDVYESSLKEALIELDTFDLVINQLPSSDYLLKLVETQDNQPSVLASLIEGGTPYVITNYTSVDLLKLYSLLRTYGFKSDGGINTVNHTVSMPKKMQSKLYNWGEYNLFITGKDDISLDIHQDNWLLFDKAIIYMLHHSESLDVDSVFHQVDENSFCLFDFIYVNSETRKSDFVYLGDKCSMLLPDVYFQPLVFTDSLDDKADQLYWALSILNYILCNVSEEKESA